MDKLKSCPFCGGTGEIYVETNTFYRFVECNFCHARTGFATFEEKAAEAWNMRTGGEDERRKSYQSASELD